MASTKTLLYYGALLRGVGEIVHRNSDSQQPPGVLGAEFISSKVASSNPLFGGEDGLRLLEQVRYQHVKELGLTSGVSDDSLAYINCFANTITMGEECDLSSSRPTDRNAKLRKIFNTLRGRHDDGVIEHDDYSTILKALCDGLACVGISDREVNSVIDLMERTTSAVPASLSANGLTDVSVYDHVRTTAGVAACVFDYLNERGVTSYRKALFEPDDDVDPRETPMFLLYSCDMSGIQSFIYSISGSGALKQLRARSMYLELLLEHIADELLERLGLNRANLLYTGGGHAYMLLPNTDRTTEALGRFDDELRSWFLKQYLTDLYVASAWVTCSANDLANVGPDKRRYATLYHRLSRGLSEAKAARYDARTIRKLNFGKLEAYDRGRECSECHRSDLRIDQDDKCTVCAALGRISRSLVDKDVFAIESEGAHEGGRVPVDSLALPFGYRLRMYTHEWYAAHRPDAHRTYAKNGVVLPGVNATNIWMGDYAAEVGAEGIAAYAGRSATLNTEETGLGLRRLGVLRADVDDLGATFVSGIPDERMSISRTSTLSRALSYFFKYKINEVLRAGDYQVQIIYSGGDDLFVIGNWSDVISAAVDIRKALDTYTGNGVLTISGGIGMYGATYPIARMAKETGELEDAAKDHPQGRKVKTKNAIALWSADTVFGWDEFIDVVVPRVQEVREMFEGNQKGSSFIYRLIALLRSFDSVASAPRLAYLLARSFEDDGSRGSESSRRLYGWAQDPHERRCLIAAMEWYVCSVREGSEQ